MMGFPRAHEIKHSHSQQGWQYTFFMGTGFGPCSSAIFGVPGWEDTLASSFEEAIGLWLFGDVIYAECQFGGSQLYVFMSPAHTPAMNNSPNSTALYNLSRATTQICLRAHSRVTASTCPPRLLHARMQPSRAALARNGNC